MLSNDHKRFNFTVSTAFLPPERRGGPNPLVTASDQEYRWATLNAALAERHVRAAVHRGARYRSGGT